MYSEPTPSPLNLKYSVEAGRSRALARQVEGEHVNVCPTGTYVYPERNITPTHLACRGLCSTNNCECEASGERYRRICNVHVTPPLSCGGKLPIGRHSSVFTGRHAYLLQLLPNTKLFHTFTVCDGGQKNSTREELFSFFR